METVMYEMKFVGFKIVTKEYATNVVHIEVNRSDTCLTNHIMLINTNQILKVI